jgi:hypothetical protein
MIANRWRPIAHSAVVPGVGKRGRGGAQVRCGSPAARAYPVGLGMAAVMTGCSCVAVGAGAAGGSGRESAVGTVGGVVGELVRASLCGVIAGVVGVEIGTEIGQGGDSRDRDGGAAVGHLSRSRKV